MTRNDFIRSFSWVRPQDIEQALRATEHSYSKYDLTGKHIPQINEKENLLEVIHSRDHYVIDSPVDWRIFCLRPEHRAKAFILTPSVSRENPNTEDLILHKERAKVGNLFSFGIDGGDGNVMIDRIDEHFRHVFDMPKVKAASKENSPDVIKERERSAHTNLVEKDQIWTRVFAELLFLTLPENGGIRSNAMISSKAADLPTPEQLKKPIAKFKAEILKRLPECKHNINKSKVVVELCYATLLLEDDKETRKKYDRLNYPNVPAVSESVTSK